MAEEEITLGTSYAAGTEVFALMTRNYMARWQAKNVAAWASHRPLAQTSTIVPLRSIHWWTIPIWKS